jgi:hypothetical protein
MGCSRNPREEEVAAGTYCASPVPATGSSGEAAHTHRGAAFGESARRLNRPERRSEYPKQFLQNACSNNAMSFFMAEITSSPSGHVYPPVPLFELSGKGARGNGSVTRRGLLTRESESFSAQPTLGDPKSGCSSRDPFGLSRNGEFSSTPPNVPKSSGERRKTKKGGRNALPAFSVYPPVCESGESSAKAPREEHSSSQCASLGSREAQTVRIEGSKGYTSRAVGHRETFHSPSNERSS